MLNPVLIAVSLGCWVCGSHNCDDPKKDKAVANVTNCIDFDWS